MAKQCCIQKVRCVLLAIAILFSFLWQAVVATQYTVGDSTGWGSLGFDYSDWASKNTYHVGDSLYFAYPAGSHSVVQLSEQDYQSCSTSNAIESDNGAGNKVVQLKAPGKYYFACGVLDHCGQGMKFSITVSGPGSSSSSPNTPSNESSSSPSTPVTSSSTPSSAESTTVPALTSDAPKNIADHAIKAATIMFCVGLVTVGSLFVAA